MITEKDMQHGRDFSGENVSGWLMSEKFNGCRAYWDGSTMWSRGGKVINIPQQMRVMLPVDLCLDGEIYCPVNFNNAKRAVQQSLFCESVVFIAFDIPSHPGNFAERYLHLSRLVKPHTNHVKLAVQYKCHGTESAIQFMKSIQTAGGEGVMLHDPADLYQSGRTRGLLKLKMEPCHD